MKYFIDKALNEYDLLVSAFKEFNLDYESLEIIKNENGKPFIKNSNLYFNKSHSYDYVVIAIDKNNVGIDIEKIRPFDEKVLASFMNEEEQNYILSNKKTINERFFAMWTKKEALIKYYGLSLKDINSVCLKENLKIITKKVKKEYILTVVYEK